MNTQPLADASSAETVRATVRDAYGKIAVGSSSSCCAQPGCCGSGSDAAEAVAAVVGYSAADIAALPDGANMGLSCGNPNALAALRSGEVLLDLGSGGGFDVFIAGPAVGPTGRAIGVDMTSEMLAKARKHLAAYRERSGLDNVEFRLGEIEHLPVADGTVDVVISNCVINLSPDKPQVWREIARVLKPGGRVAVSDLALLQPLPAEVRSMVEALVGCVAGAVLVADTERMARAAGLTDIQLNPRSAYVDAMVDTQDPLYQKIMAHLPAGARPSEFITSLEITARKLASSTPGIASTSETHDMPTYVYETIPQDAAEQPEFFEIKQSMHDEPLTSHPESGKPVRRVILGGYGVLKSGGAEKPSAGDSCCCGPSGCCD